MTTQNYLNEHTKILFIRVITLGNSNFLFSYFSVITFLVTLAYI